MPSLARRIFLGSFSLGLAEATAVVAARADSQPDGLSNKHSPTLQLADTGAPDLSSTPRTQRQTTPLPRNARSVNVDQLLERAAHLRSALVALWSDWRIIQTSKLSLDLSLRELENEVNVRLPQQIKGIESAISSAEQDRDAFASDALALDQQLALANNAAATYYNDAKIESDADLDRQLGAIEMHHLEGLLPSLFPPTITDDKGNVPTNVGQMYSYILKVKAKESMQIQADELANRAAALQFIITAAKARTASAAARADTLRAQKAELEALLDIRTSTLASQQAAQSSGVLNVDERIAFIQSRYPELAKWFDDICSDLADATFLLFSTVEDMSYQFTAVGNAMKQLTVNPLTPNDATQELRMHLFDYLADMVRRVSLVSSESIRTLKFSLVRTAGSLTGSFSFDAEDELIRPRLRSVIALVAPGQGELALQLRLTPPRESRLRAFVDPTQLKHDKIIADSSGYVRLIQSGTAEIVIGPVLPPPAAVSVALTDGPNCNVSPVGRWIVTGNLLAGAVDLQEVEILISLTFDDFNVVMS